MVAQLPPKTQVVNVKVAHIRPSYTNLADWIADSRNAYIGRKGVVFVPDSTDASKQQRFPPKASTFANPFKVASEAGRQECLQRYEVYMRKRLQTEPAVLSELLELRGKKLGCWCHPKACHGDVLVKLIEEHVLKQSTEAEATEPSASGECEAM